MDVPPQSITITLPEAAALLGISESLARQLARRGEFPGAFKLGGRTLVHRQVFLEEVERRARGQSLAQANPDHLLERALRDAHARARALDPRSGAA